MAFACRYIVVFVLWVAKFALLLPNLASRHLWSYNTRWLLYSAGPILFVTGFLSIGLLWQVMSNTVNALDDATIRYVLI